MYSLSSPILVKLIESDKLLILTVGAAWPTHGPVRHSPATVKTRAQASCSWRVTQLARRAAGASCASFNTTQTASISVSPTRHASSSWRVIQSGTCWYRTCCRRPAIRSQAAKRRPVPEMPNQLSVARAVRRPPVFGITKPVR